MKSHPFSKADAHLLTLALLSCLLTLLQCRPTSEEITINREIVQTDTTALPKVLQENLAILDGSVIIRLEPHGSIRAEVFKNQRAQYEFILDREKQQNLLTRRSIDHADVYYVSWHTGLVIDDLTAQKRYILVNKGLPDPQIINRLQHSKFKNILIKGYGQCINSGGFTGLEE